MSFGITCDTWNSWEGVLGTLRLAWDTWLTGVPIREMQLELGVLDFPDLSGRMFRV